MWGVLLCLLLACVLADQGSSRPSGRSRLAPHAHNLAGTFIRACGSAEVCPSMLVYCLFKTSASCVLCVQHTCIVDPRFREQFQVGHPTPAYTSLLKVSEAAAGRAVGCCLAGTALDVCSEPLFLGCQPAKGAPG